MSEHCDAFFQYGPARSANSKVHWLVTIPFGVKDCASWISAVRLHVMCLLTRRGGWLEKDAETRKGCYLCASMSSPVITAVPPLS